MFRDQWPTTRVLDLGVGTGRTAAIFGPEAAEYLGVDFSKGMIEECRERFPPPTDLRFQMGDARSMPELADGSFDFILFSFNGIDYVPYDDRAKVFAEVRRLLSPEGHFLFSSHSLNAFPFRLSVPRSPPGLEYWWRWLRTKWMGRRLAWRNRNVDPTAAHSRGYAILRDQVRMLKTCYVTPQREVERLVEQGLETIDILNGDGDPVRADDAGPDFMLHYLCRKSASI